MRLRLIIAPAAALTLAACGDDPDTAVEEAVEEGRAEALVGEDLTLRSEVGEVLSDQAFIINGEYFGFDGEGTLVVGAGDAPEPINEGDVVSVNGTLREFVIADVEDEYDLDLDDDLLVRYEEQFAVVADSVEVVPAEAAEATLSVGDTLTVDAPPGSAVTVTGSVREFTLADLEERLGFDLDDDLLAELEDELAIVADRVEVVPGVD